MRVTLYSVSLAGAVLAFGAACGRDAGTGGEAASAEPGASAAVDPAAEPSVRAQLEPWRSLIDEVGRAELDAGGALIDLGTADGHKFTAGGFETGWGRNALDGGISFAPITDDSATLDVLVRQPAVAELVLRARSEAGERAVSVSLGGSELGQATIGKDWTIARVEGPSKPKSGLTTVVLSGAEGVGGVEVDWVWLAETAGGEPLLVPRTAPVRLGGRLRRAIVTPGPRTYSYYLHVPEGGSLVFDYGAEPARSFAVRVTPVQGEPFEVFRGEGGPRWTEARVDLARWAGQGVRLDLVSEGPTALAGWGEPALMRPRTQARPPLAPSPPADNIIVIVLDTARADAFRTVNPESVVNMPAFDELAKTGVAFTNAYNNENWTKPSVATLLSGTYPDAHGARGRDSVLPDEVELISEHLAAQGFATASVIANRVVSAKFGFDQGWGADLRAVGADDVYDQAIGWLAARDPKTRFLLYLQPFDPHIPYEVDPKYSAPYYESSYEGPLGPVFDTAEQVEVNDKKRTVSDDDTRWIRALYNGELTWHDEHFGRFIANLRETGLLENTLIVFTNDHGEEFYEHGLLGHGWSLFDSLLRAPLLMHFPPMFPPGSRIAEHVEHVDVVATALDALGVPPMTTSEGMSLMPLIRGDSGRLRPYYAVSWARGTSEGRAVHVGRWKYVRGGRLWSALYDLGADPGENINLLGKQPIAERLGQVYLGEALANRRKLQRLEDVTEVRQVQEIPAKLDDKTRKELEALGYFGE